MSHIFGNSMYPPTKTNAADYPIERYLTVTYDMQHNPVVTALVAYGEIANADLIWMANHIKNPYKELTFGRILAIPSLSRSSSMQVKGGSKATKKAVNVKVRGTKITY